eukprot:COSAG05_NODE_7819_length_766_cov_1.184408_1_plen_63_part_10
MDPLRSIRNGFVHGDVWSLYDTRDIRCLFDTVVCTIVVTVPILISMPHGPLREASIAVLSENC